jgi:hypothetical protein
MPIRYKRTRDSTALELLQDRKVISGMVPTEAGEFLIDEENSQSLPILL